MDGHNVAKVVVDCVCAAIAGCLCCSGRICRPHFRHPYDNACNRYDCFVGVMSLVKPLVSAFHGPGYFQKFLSVRLALVAGGRE